MPNPAKVIDADRATDGGDPNTPGLEQRVSRLEDDMREVKDVLKTQVVPYLVRMDAILPYLATKEDVANLRTELKSDIAEAKVDLGNRIGKVETELGNRIGKVETELGNRIGKVETELGNRIAKAETELGNRIGKVETELGNRISKVETELGNRISKVEGMVARSPTTLQLAGFVIAIFVTSGLIRWVFGP